VDAEPVQRKARRVKVDWSGAPVDDRMVIAWRIPGEDPTQTETVAAAVIRSLLSSRNGTLHRALVEEQSLAWRVHSPEWGQADPGLFQVWITARPGADLGRIETVVDEAVHALASVSAVRLDEERGRLRRKWLLALTGPEDVAFAVGGAARRGGGIDALDQSLQALQGLEPEDLRAFVERFLVDSGRTTAILEGGGEP
jgi:predicted Zn-dependent peptidase